VVTAELLEQGRPMAWTTTEAAAQAVWAVVEEPVTSRGQAGEGVRCFDETGGYRNFAGQALALVPTAPVVATIYVVK
jgi:hypothetical protein